MSLGLRKIQQPYILAYILAGVMLGPHGFQVFTDEESADVAGEIGLIILMFFIGMEISIKNFIKNWKIAFLGAGCQVLFSVLLMYGLGIFFDWTFERVLLFGFGTSLSSSAVVIRLINQYKLEKHKLGQDITFILLTQDVLVAPMIIVMSLASGKGVDYTEVLWQIFGAIVLLIIIVDLLKRDRKSIKALSFLNEDHELQVFASLIICFGLALFTSLCGLSPSLGAFVAGLTMYNSNASSWLHKTLSPFRIIFVSIFFISVGMMIDIHFLTQHWQTILVLVLAVFISNHLINSTTLRILKNSNIHSLYGGSLLAQIGEFSFVLASLGVQNNIINSESYQYIIITISITIFISSIWVSLFKKIYEIRFS
ncbi:cation:proton antiporter domain-containing protein [Sediminitomix flava]